VSVPDLAEERTVSDASAKSISTIQSETRETDAMEADAGSLSQPSPYLSAFLGGSVLVAVCRSGLSALPKSLELRQAFVDILKSSARRDHIQHVISLVVDDTRNSLAPHDETAALFVATVDSPSQEALAAAIVSAMRSRASLQAWIAGLRYLQRIAPHIPAEATAAIHDALRETTCKDVSPSPLSSESVWTAAIDGLVAAHRIQQAVNMSVRAVERCPSSAPLWARRISCAIVGVLVMADTSLPSAATSDSTAIPGDAPIHSPPPPSKSKRSRTTSTSVASTAPPAAPSATPAPKPEPSSPPSVPSLENVSAAAARAGLRAAKAALQRLHDLPSLADMATNLALVLHALLDELGFPQSPSPGSSTPSRSSVVDLALAESRPTAARLAAPLYESLAVQELLQFFTLQTIRDLSESDQLRFLAWLGASTAPPARIESIALELSQTRPVAEAVYLRCAELLLASASPATRSSAEMHVRRLYERACSDYGSTSSAVWHAYISWERQLDAGGVQRAALLHNRAIKSLTNPAAFLAEASLRGPAP
jgi:hypothetical protein